MEIISSTSNPLIKKIRALHNRKARVDSKTFLVEGIYHVGEVIQSDWDVEIILYAPELLVSKFAQDLLKRITNIKLQPVSINVIKTLTEKENPQGVVAVVKQKKLAFEDLRNVNRIVALVSPQDPGNVGTILRTVDAVQIDAFFLLNGGVELYHPSVIRASMGALFWKPVIQTSFDEFARWIKSNKIQLIGSSAKTNVDYRTITPQIPWALVLGNEQKGLTVEQMDACDVTVSLPMHG
ncbi:MAG TPA: RNA methyltransferase, partial [Anaerolineales bacterium]|nr:RNA methyltransferase [Anaerolineales bacterium]